MRKMSEIVWEAIEEDSESFTSNMFYDGTEGFVSGSDTSEERARVRAPSAIDLQKRIYNAILMSGAKGRTSAELEIQLDEKHQSVSASIRNMELGGKLIKLAEKRKGSHPYVSISLKGILDPDMILPPTKVRAYKSKYEQLLQDIREIVAYEPRLTVRGTYTADELLHTKAHQDLIGRLAELVKEHDIINNS
jgi:hypothetical protein